MARHLTGSLSFHNYRNMERDMDSPGALLLTDAALEQLKQQAPEGCLLCALQAFEAEDWD